MTTGALLTLSTRLVRDLKDWSEEVTRRDALSPDQLHLLRAAADIIENATFSATPDDAIDTALPEDPAPS